MRGFSGRISSPKPCSAVIDCIPSSMHPTFTIDNPPPASMFTDLIHAYTERAHQLGDSVFSSLSPVINSITKAVSPVYKALLDAFDVASAAAETFVKEMEALVGLVDEEKDQLSSTGDLVDQTHEFSAFEVKGLAEMQFEKGRQSEQYLTAAKSVQAVLSNVSRMLDFYYSFQTLTYLLPTELQPALQDKKVAVIVVPHERPSSRNRRLMKRQESSTTPAAPGSGVVFSESTCFASNTTCAESTDSCSGHGSCIATTRAGKTCYTCSCGVTKNEQGRRQWWAGQSCEKLDLSTYVDPTSFITRYSNLNVFS